MKIYYADDLTYPEPRLHPYAPGAPDQHGYEDFKANPAAIRTVLEDYLPFGQQRAIQTFYAFLEWINGRDSYLETNDCVLRAPVENKDPTSHHAIKILGRVVILFRNLSDNASADNARWLCHQFMQKLEAIDPDFPSTSAVLGFTLNPAIQVALSKGSWLADGKSFDAGPDDPGHALHLAATFWVFGDTEADAFQNLDRLFKNLWQASRAISEEIRVAYVAAKAEATNPSPTSTVVPDEGSIAGRRPWPQLCILSRE